MALAAAPAPPPTGFLAALDEAERSDLLGVAVGCAIRRAATVFHEGGGSGCHRCRVSGA